MRLSDLRTEICEILFALAIASVILACGDATSNSENQDSSIGGVSSTDLPSSSNADLPEKSSSLDEGISSPVVSSSSSYSRETSSEASTPRSASVRSSSSAGICSSFDKDQELCDIRDGNVYPFVTIGTQTWMAKNLAYLPSVNAHLDISSTDATYHVFGFDGTEVQFADNNGNYSLYGVLYNWHAATKSCPSGWHLPTAAEWDTLIEFAHGPKYAGEVLKSKTGWNTTTSERGNDEYGFSALPGGYHDGSNIDNAGNYGYWWSGTPSEDTSAYYQTMYYYDKTMPTRVRNKYFGFSVRCLRD